MWFKSQPWNLTADDCNPDEIEWNMWSRRLPPYAHLDVGDRNITVGPGAAEDTGGEPFRCTVHPASIRNLARAGDPDLHTHVAVSNKVQARNDGQ